MVVALIELPLYKVVKAMPCAFLLLLFATLEGKNSSSFYLVFDY